MAVSPVRNVFVTGTGTGVGKTFISAILAEALHADYWKPVQAGYDTVTDSEWVKSLLSNTDSIIHPETYKLKLGASPHIAARQENLRINLSDFLLPQSSNGIVIEGAGGLMVPLNEQEFVADLITMLKVPVILVSRNMLGSINHSLLTAMACKQLGIRVLGWIFNDDYMEYEKEIEAWSGIPALASVPYAEKADRFFIREQAERLRNLMHTWPW